MKVIFDNSEGWSTQIDCRHCESRMEIEADDVMQGDFGAMGDYDKEFYVVCPICHANIILRELPSFVKNNVGAQRAR